jgi:hypothetical protein
MSRDSGWGAQLGRQKKALAFIVESQLRQLEKYFALSLPTMRPRLKRARHDVPRLTLPPDEQAIRRCTTLLAFLRDVRFSANYAGFASARGKTLETLCEELDVYVEELIEILKTGEEDSGGRARAFLEIAAGLSDLLRDERAGELVRRRGAAARHPQTDRFAAEA